MKYCLLHVHEGEVNVTVSLIIHNYLATILSFTWSCMWRVRRLQKAITVYWGEGAERNLACSFGRWKYKTFLAGTL